MCYLAHNLCLGVYMPCLLLICIHLAKEVPPDSEAHKEEVYLLTTQPLLQDGTNKGRCVWESDSVLEVQLGANPTMVPGSVLQLRQSAIRSKNGFSGYADPALTASVFLPSLPKLQLSGTTVNVIYTYIHIYIYIM
jgi:hypothetical protein